MPTLFPRPFARRLAPMLALVIMATAPALAQAPQAARVRGTVEAVDGAKLTVRSREGASVAIALADNWTITGVAKASLADIKPGAFVGAAAMGQGSDALKAVEVLIFPAGVKSGEGHYPWDLLPESTMTNATVASTVEGVNGPTITLSYPGGEKKITVPPDVPIVAFAPAEKADLKTGAPVFVPAQRQADGTLTASRVIVGNHGVAPPM